MQKQPANEFYKKVVLKDFPKEAPAQFSCEYCEILKNTYFQEQLRTTTFLYGAP